MNYAQIRKYDVANGPGIRTTIFVTGCKIRCKDCFNEDYQNPEYGNNYTEETKKEILENLSLNQVSGLSILGGEPLDYDDDNKNEVLTDLVMEVEKTGKTIWIWSGHIFEELIKTPVFKNLLMHCDVLVDGPFISDKKNMNLLFRGSENQRLINLRETFKNNCEEIILVDESKFKV